MSEAEGGGPERPELLGAISQMQLFELGGSVQEEGLADHGRIVIERVGITIEGPTPTIVIGIAVVGAVASALVGLQPNGLTPGLSSMGTIVVVIFIYFRRPG